jgi:hypothetical protein
MFGRWKYVSENILEKKTWDIDSTKKKRKQNLEKKQQIKRFKITWVVLKTHKKTICEVNKEKTKSNH